ncbi:MAG: hypothetical protein RXN92_01745 [Thermoplasmatales archaeon]
MEERVVTVVYPIIKNPTGNKRYAERILKGLNEAGFRHREVGIRKIEIHCGEIHLAASFLSTWV